MSDPGGADRRTAAALVSGQAVLLAALAVLPRRRDWPTPAWLRLAAAGGQAGGLALAAVAAAGLGPGLTASPLPNAAAELRTDGLYGRVRHPIYSGVLLAAGSRAAASGNRAAAGAFGALVGLLTVKAGFEERRLARRFPGYPAYAAGTPRFVPGRQAWRRRRPGRAD